MGIEWIIIIIIILIGLVFVKFEHHTHIIKIVLVVLIGFMLYFSIVGFSNSEKIDFTSPKGVVNAVGIYFGLIGQTATTLWDIGKDTTHLVGNSIRVEKDDKKDNHEQ